MLPALLIVMSALIQQLALLAIQNIQALLVISARQDITVLQEAFALSVQLM